MMELSAFWTPAQLNVWLDALAGEIPLFAPRQVGGVSLYRRIAGSVELDWDFDRPVLPVKEFFFPPTERLFIIEKTGQQITFSESLPGEDQARIERRWPVEQAVFGVRPCDARGVKILDALFLDTPPADPYYADRRERTALIGLACKTMGDTCFCTSLGGAPDDSRDVDVMVHEIDGGYWIEVITEKGKALVENCEPGIAEDRAMRNSQFQIRNPQPEVAIPLPESWPALFSSEIWERLAERCLSCRLCAYVCPTCRCFDIRDEALPAGSGVAAAERIRCWDSCTGPAYRRIAGGHNPRPTKGQRLRNRFFCKFYYYPLQYNLGSAACTGCGRCIEYCPVGVDIVEALDLVAREAGHE
jgi:ferredoxin